MSDVTIGQEIERRMLAAGMNRKELSLKAGLGATYVRDVLTGKSKHPRRAAIDKIAAALGCNPIDLYKGKARQNIRLMDEEPHDSEKIIDDIASSMAFAEYTFGSNKGNLAFEFFSQAFDIWIDVAGGKIKSYQYRLMSNIVTTMFSQTLHGAEAFLQMLAPAVLLIDATYHQTKEIGDEDKALDYYRVLLRSISENVQALVAESRSNPTESN